MGDLFRQCEHELEKNFQTYSVSEGSEFLLRTKSRDNVGTVNAVGRPPDRGGKADSFHELIANFYSLKTKKIPAGRLALGDGLGRYGVFSGVGTLA